MNRAICIGLIAGALATGAAGAGEGWETDMAAAQKAAAARQVPILVDFSGSDWCGWCKKLDREVFSQEAFKAYAKENLVLLLIDFPRQKEQSDVEKKTNQTLAEQYGVQGFPTVLLLDADGKVIAPKTGYRPGGAEAYVKYLQGLLAKVKKPEPAAPAK